MMQVKTRKVCALCASEIPEGRTWGKYCSRSCADAVTAAREPATRAISSEIRAGRIPSPKTCACVDCGAPAKDYDHRRYLDPLSVEPTCRSCNLKRGPAEDVANAVLNHFGSTEEIGVFMARRKVLLNDQKPALRPAAKASIQKEEVARVINHAGGDTEFARLLGIDDQPGFQQRVNNWKRRGMPAAVALEHYAVIQELRRRTRSNATSEAA